MKCYFCQALDIFSTWRGGLGRVTWNSEALLEFLFGDRHSLVDFFWAWCKDVTSSMQYSICNWAHRPTLLWQQSSLKNTNCSDQKIVLIWYESYTSVKVKIHWGNTEEIPVRNCRNLSPEPLEPFNARTITLPSQGHPVMTIGDMWWNWMGGKVQMGALKWGLKATLCNSCTIVCNCAH